MASPPYRKALDLESERCIAISNLSHMSDHSEGLCTEPAFSMARFSMQRHVALLDELALLFVFGGENQAVAISWMVETDRIRVMWANNEPAPPSPTQQEYMDQMVQHLSRLDHVDEILSTVVSGCRYKAVMRCQKAAKQCSPLIHNHTNIFNVSASDEVYHQLQRKLKDRGMTEEGTPLEVSLDWFAHALANISENSTMDEIRVVIAFAHIITTGSPPISELVNEFQLHRFQKLGEYRAACFKALNECRKLPVKLRQNIHIEQVDRSPMYPLLEYVDQRYLDSYSTGAICFRSSADCGRLQPSIQASSDRHRDQGVCGRYCTLFEHRTRFKWRS